MYQIRKQIIDDILTGSFSCHEMKVWLWFATEYPDKFKPDASETPISSIASKISQKLGMTVDQFYKSFRILCLSNVALWKNKYMDDESHRVKEIPNKHTDRMPLEPQKSTNLNDSGTKEYIKALESSGIILSISQKVELNKLVNKYKNFDGILERWFQYQEYFKDVKTGERLSAYLFGSKFHNLQNNIEKFKDDAIFSKVFQEHKERFNAYKNKPVSYGFSDDPKEDKELAMEKERSDIALSFQVGLPYDAHIIFPENIEFFDKKMKKAKKEAK